MSENNEISLNHRDPLGIRSSTLLPPSNPRFHPPLSPASELRASNTPELEDNETKGKERKGKERVQGNARRKRADGSNDSDVSESISFACYFAPYRGRKRRVLARRCRFIPSVARRRFQFRFLDSPRDSVSPRKAKNLDRRIFSVELWFVIYCFTGTICIDVILNNPKRCSRAVRCNRNPHVFASNTQIHKPYLCQTDLHKRLMKTTKEFHSTVGKSRNTDIRRN